MQGLTSCSPIPTKSERTQQAENILKRLKSAKFAKTIDYLEALSLATVATIILSEVENL